MRSLVLLASLLSLVLAATAHADTRTETVVVAPGGTNWNSSASFAKFNPIDGLLESITITTIAEIRGTTAGENTSAVPVVTTATFAAYVTITMPDLSVIGAPTPAGVFIDTLGPFDGTLDYAGSSGVTHAGIVATDTRTVVHPPPASFLALFTGFGQILLPVVAQDASTWHGHAPARTMQTASATITLTYTFSPWPSTPFCAGDGSGTPCPCGNTGASGNGCASSFASAGARLIDIGIPSALDDSLSLVATGVSSAPVLFFQGTLPQNGGLGSTFGDGLQCAGGATIRLGTASPSGGSAWFPAGGPSISVLGSIPPGGGVTRYYQALYRDLAPFCTPTAFNLTNGIVSVWTP